MNLKNIRYEIRAHGTFDNQNHAVFPELTISSQR